MIFSRTAVFHIELVQSCVMWLNLLRIMGALDVMIAAMIMGAAFAAVVYNLKQCHPTRNEPVIDYDIALLFQPMLLLGISIGVTFNIMFADWMVTLLLILLFTSTHTKTLIEFLLCT